MSGIKCTVVGNSLVGKSTLMLYFKDGTFTENPPPKVDEFTKTVNVDGVDYQLLCTDTRSSEAEDRMRPLSYPNTNVFLVTFSYTDTASFSNVSTQWIKELTHHSTTPTPFFLVGLKQDADRKVSEEEVKALLAKTDKIEGTFSVSCKQDKGVKELLAAVAKAGAKHMKGITGGGDTHANNDTEPKVIKRKSKCVIF